MTVLVVGDAGGVEGEIWYRRLEGILWIFNMMRSGRILCNWANNESGRLVRKYAERVGLFGTV